MKNLSACRVKHKGNYRKRPTMAEKSGCSSSSIYIGTHTRNCSYNGAEIFYSASVLIQKISQNQYYAHSGEFGRLYMQKTEIVPRPRPFGGDAEYKDPRQKNS